MAVRAGLLSDARVVALLRKYFISVEMPELCTQELIADPDDVKLLQKYDQQVVGGLYGGEREVFFTPNGTVVESLVSLNHGGGQYTVKGRKAIDPAVTRFFEAAAKAYRMVHGKLPGDWEAFLDGTAPEVKAVAEMTVPWPRGEPEKVALVVWFRHDFHMYEELAGAEIIHFTADEARSLLPPSWEAKAEHSWPKDLALRMARTFHPRGGGVLIRLNDSSISIQLTSRIVAVDERTVSGSLAGNFAIKPETAGERGNRESYRPFAGCQGRLKGDFVWDRRSERFTQFRLVCPDGKAKSSYVPPKTKAEVDFIFGAELLPSGNAPERSFAPAEIDRKRWGITDEDFATLSTRIELGKLFFEGKDRKAFVKRLEQLKHSADQPIEMGWVVPQEGRCLVVSLSRSLAQLKEMSDKEFASYRDEWSLDAEVEYRRFHPWPGTIKGYGGEESRESALKVTRVLINAKTKKDFLAAIKDGVAGGYITLLFVPRGGQGATMYGLPVDQLEGLTEEQFQTWRKRFLRWVEIHCPGQSLVKSMAEADDKEFEKTYVQSREKFGGFDISRALRNFHARTGVQLQKPAYGKRLIAPVVESVDPTEGAVKESLQPGDTILSVEGRPVTEWDECIYRLSAYRHGSIVRLTVQPKATDKEEVRFLKIR